MNRELCAQGNSVVLGDNRRRWLNRTIRLFFNSPLATNHLQLLLRGRLHRFLQRFTNAVERFEQIGVRRQFLGELFKHL